MDGQPKDGSCHMLLFAFPVLAWAIAFSSFHFSGSWFSWGCTASVHCSLHNAPFAHLHSLPFASSCLW